MAAADVAKMAIITPFGLFEYVSMPFGLLNSAQTFQRLMDTIFRLNFTFVYLDDILVASRSAAEHVEHLRVVLTVLSANGLLFNPSKCVFARPVVDFLGHRVSGAVIVPLQRHVEAVLSFPPPSDVNQLQCFLELVNFYRCFLPAIAPRCGPSLMCWLACQSGWSGPLLSRLLLMPPRLP